MLFAIVTLSSILVSIHAGSPEKPKDPPKELYEEFFRLVVDGLKWNVGMAREARKVLYKKEKVKEGYEKVLLRRDFGASPLSTNEEVLLTLDVLWIKPRPLQKVQDLCPGSEFGCYYAYNWKRGGEEYLLKVLCLFKRVTDEGEA